MYNEVKSYKHFVITRFNIRINWESRLKNPDNNPKKRILEDNYLEERFRIFEKYTLQSLKEQSNLNFTWLILFHKDTPKRFLDRIQELKNEFKFVDLYFDDDENFDFNNYRDENKERYQYFITTRIDNDDMISRDYIEQIQNYADNNLHECFLSFENGMKYDLLTKEKYEYNVKANHFITMVSHQKNVMQYDHSKIFDIGEEIVMLNSGGRPMWVEIVHDSNIINQIREKDKSGRLNNVVESIHNSSIMNQIWDGDKEAEDRSE